jgi:hypothetical protein
MQQEEKSKNTFFAGKYMQKEVKEAKYAGF